MAYIGEMINKYGTQISAYACDACDGDFTVCPSQHEYPESYESGCLADTCGSYDPARDCDVMFMSAAEIVRTKPTKHLMALLSNDARPHREKRGE